MGGEENQLFGGSQSNLLISSSNTQQCDCRSGGSQRCCEPWLGSCRHCDGKEKWEHQRCRRGKDRWKESATIIDRIKGREG